MEKKCKNCKWWGWWDCAREGMGIPNNSYCNHPKIDYGEAPKTLDGASYEDGEGWSASFRVGADFGCIHFERR